MPPDDSRRRRAERSLLDFEGEYLAHFHTEPCGTVHIELCDELDTALLPGQRLVGALPREHAKTTHGTVSLGVYAICTRKKKYIRIWGANEAEAKAKLNNIMLELESNAALKADYGDEIKPMLDSKGSPVKATDTEVVFKNGVKIHALPFLGKARGMLFRGKRPDLDIIDDPEDDTTVVSKEWRKKATGWVNKALLNSLDSKTGSLVWLGTILHFDSLLANLLNPKVKGEKPAPQWRRMFKTAIIVKEGHGLWDKDEQGQWINTPLWPERWPMNKLHAKYLEIGVFEFQSEFMNNPLDPESQIFRRGMFKRYNFDLLESKDGRWWLPAPPIPGRATDSKLKPLEVFEVADLAMEVGVDHDHSAYMIVGSMWLTDMEAPLVFILHCSREKISIGQQAARITALYRTWKPSRIGLGKQTGGHMMKSQALEKGLPMTEVPEIDSKHARITAGAGFVERGLVYVPADAPWLEDFFSEAENYNGAKKKPQDDQLDCLAHAIYLCTLRSGILIYRSRHKRKALKASNF